MADRVHVQCPCCDTKLTVDTDTGEILAEERPKVDTKKTFEKAMGEVKGGTKRREDAFAKAFDRTQKMEDLLEKKFEEAQKKASKDKGKPKPRGPFDFD